VLPGLQAGGIEPNTFRRAVGEAPQGITSHLPVDFSPDRVTLPSGLDVLLLRPRLWALLNGGKHDRSASGQEELHHVR
jgi:hypothetical protein